MSSTNKTANYELSQFVGTDIPSILSDYNGDMRKIDAGIAEVATSAGSSASAISALAGRVTTAENSITTLNGALEVTNQRSIQNQTAINAVQGVIPNDASTENLLATSEVVSDIADDVRGIDTRVTALEQGGSGHRILYQHDGSTITYKELFENMYNALAPYKDDLTVILNAKIFEATSGISHYQYSGIPTSISDTRIGEFDAIWTDGGSTSDNTSHLAWQRITLEATAVQSQGTSTDIASNGTVTVTSRNRNTSDTTSHKWFLYV